MFKHERLGFFGLFWIIKHFPHHMGQILIQLTVDTHTNAEHKESPSLYLQKMEKVLRHRAGNAACPHQPPPLSPS